MTVKLAFGPDTVDRCLGSRPHCLLVDGDVVLLSLASLLGTVPSPNHLDSRTRAS